MHITDSIELQVSLLLFVALAGYFLSSKIKQPAVVGQILLGIMIGPSLLGWVTYTTLVSNLAHIGAIVLLFVVGLEFRLKDIMRWQYLLIGLFGVIVSLAGGYALAKLFEFDSNKAVFLGICLTATSIAEIFSLSAIVGAIVAGVAMEGVKLKNSKDFKEGAEYVRTLFAAMFFVSLGVLVDLSVLDLQLVGFLILITLVALLTKLIGCGLPARLLGYSNRELLIIGLGMAPRGK